jgi:hypothetical protein
MSPSKPTGKKEGGIGLKADSVNISGSEVVGRDHIEGMSGSEVNQIIETLLKHFPKGYLHNPGELDKALSEFRTYHEQLHEYKELHNGINEILVAFEPYKAEMDRSNSRKSLPKLSHLRDLWRPVSLTVISLLNWSQTIKNIGKPYQLLDDKRKSGEDWAIQFSELQSRINEHLGLTGPLSVREIDYPSQLQILSFQRLGAEIPWWETLSELTSSFSHTASHHMNSADKQLRQTAQELFNLSNKALSNY